MKPYKAIIALLFLAGLVSCAKSRMDVIVRPDVPKWKVAKELSYEYQRLDSRGDKLLVARKGIEYGDACIDETPKNPACYYYHAINTGLYYKTKVIGYQKGLKSMIADCENIISIDPSYDHGGAYRMLGLIYTQVPASSISRDPILRDVDKAVAYIKKALALDSDFPENYLVLARAYLEAGEKKDAAEALIKAKELIPKWRDHEDYLLWKRESRRLTKKLRRQIKKLPAFR